MHELAIADSIVAIASRHADGRRVAKVEVRVGHLRQVVPDALAFAFQLVAEGTCVAGAELELEEVPVAGRCRACGAEGVLDAFPLQCSGCGSLDLELVSGEELLVASLELEETLTTIGGKGDGH
jgi:hydrogenase nickel incorporation protein HypA/HybF